MGVAVIGSASENAAALLLDLFAFVSQSLIYVIDSRRVTAIVMQSASFCFSTHRRHTVSRASPPMSRFFAIAGVLSSRRGTVLNAGAAWDITAVMDQSTLTSHAVAMLDRIQHMVLATVSPDGVPWNTPVMFARVGRNFFWTSKIDAQHTANIRVNRTVFIVVFDSTMNDESGRAVYARGDASELSDRQAVKDGLAIIFQRRGMPPPNVAGFLEPAEHRVYRATIRIAWTNVLHDSNDVPWDERVEIVLDE